MCFAGAVIVFVALLSIAFLERQIGLKQWLGILTIVLGLFIVGAADILFNSSKNPDTNGIISGNLMFMFNVILYNSTNFPIVG